MLRAEIVPLSDFQYRMLACASALAIISMATTNVKAEALSLEAKSYIATVDFTDASQFDPDAKSCEQALAAVIDCAMKLGEDPADGSKASGNYRLRSELPITVTCSGNKISNWQIDPVKQDFGTEVVILATSGDLAKPLKASPNSKGNALTDKVTFSYRLRGHPHQLGIDAMNKVKPRTCSYIWHEVSGSLTCQAGKPVIAAGITGSGFPSHRLWVQGKKIKEIAQGPFKNLWKCDPSDPTLVK